MVGTADGVRYFFFSFFFFRSPPFSNPVQYPSERRGSVPDHPMFGLFDVLKSDTSRCQCALGRFARPIAAIVTSPIRTGSTAAPADL